MSKKKDDTKPKINMNNFTNISKIVLLSALTLLF